MAQVFPIRPSAVAAWKRTVASGSRSSGRTRRRVQSSSALLARRLPSHRGLGILEGRDDRAAVRRTRVERPDGVPLRGRRAGRQHRFEFLVALRSARRRCAVRRTSREEWERPFTSSSFVASNGFAVAAGTNHAGFGAARLAPPVYVALISRPVCLPLAVQPP